MVWERQCLGNTDVENTDTEKNACAKSSFILNNSTKKRERL